MSRAKLLHLLGMVLPPVHALFSDAGGGQLPEVEDMLALRGPLGVEQRRHERFGTQGALLGKTALDHGAITIQQILEVLGDGLHHDGIVELGTGLVVRRIVDGHRLHDAGHGCRNDLLQVALELGVELVAVHHLEEHATGIHIGDDGLRSYVDVTVLSLDTDGTSILHVDLSHLLVENDLAAAVLQSSCQGIGQRR